MRVKIRNMGRRMAELLNWDMMNHSYHVLVINYIFLVAYTTLESTFVNTLLFSILDDISIVIFYRGVTFFASAIMMHLAAYIGQKYSPLLVIRLGAVFYLATYLLLFFGMNHMDKLLIPIAWMSGTGGAFYWSSHTRLVPPYTTAQNRDTGIALLGIVQGIMTLLVPVISGFVIRWMPGFTGYRVMFGAGIVAVLAQAYVQRRLAPVEQKEKVSQARLAFHLWRRTRSFQLMMSYETLRGFRDGAFGFILNTVLFEIVTDESLVGINTFLTGLAAIAGSWLYGKLVRPAKRGRIVIVIGLVLSVCILPMYLLLNPVTVMTFTLISAFLTLFIVNSCSNTTYDVIGQNEITRSCMGEAAALREGALGFGRLSGLGILMLFPHEQKGYVTAMLMLTAFQVACGFLIELTHRELEQQKNAGEVPV